MTSGDNDKYPRDTGCPLHPSCVTCPEPICAYDFPGGFKAYLRYKKMRAALESSSNNIEEVAELLNVTKGTAQRIFTRIHRKTVAVGL